MNTLRGQTLVVIGGTSGIGLEVARQGRAEGADVVIVARNAARLEQVAREIDVKRSEAFDANDPARLRAFFRSLPAPVGHVMVTAGTPHYAAPLDTTREQAIQGITEHLVMAIEVARASVGRVQPSGSLTFMGGTGARRPRAGLGIVATATVGFPTLIANLALDIAPTRVNLIAAGFVDTPLSASILGKDLEKRRAELRALLPIKRVVTAADVAALAVHIMSNTALTGATFDIDGGQQLVS